MNKKEFVESVMKVLCGLLAYSKLNCTRPKVEEGVNSFRCGELGIIIYKSNYEVDTFLEEPSKTLQLYMKELQSDLKRLSVKWEIK